jgi:SAM-dependent methyltransferase
MTALPPQRYDRIGRLYARYRRPDPRIAGQIEAALGDADRVVDVGAGAGSYESPSRQVVAVEPSGVMIAQRPASAAPAIRAVADRLPLPDRSFGAAAAILTVHHWPDPRVGLAELCRVAPRRVVLTFDPAVHNRLWLLEEYVYGAAQLEESRALSVDLVAEAIGAHTVDVVPVAHDCVDGFGWAYWRRPQMYLDPEARSCISMLAQLSPGDLEPGLARLAADLRTGAWARRHADLLERHAIDGGYRLVIAG